MLFFAFLRVTFFYFVFKGTGEDVLLQGDAYTGNWLSAIRHTPKLARRMIHNELGHRAIS